jgi:hypothetical protein
MKDPKTLLTPPSIRSKAFAALMENALQGLERFYLLTTAWDSNLFEHTVTPKTAHELAHALNYHEAMTVMFCDALVEMGVLAKSGDAYVNTPLAQTYLTPSSEHYLTYTLHNMKRNADRWTQLPKLLKNGPIMQERTELFGENWLLSIAEWAQAGSVSDTINAVKPHVNWQNWRRLLDLGGGHGLYAIAFTALNPQLEAFIFDLPRVVSVTRKYVEEYNVQNVHILPGDFYHDSIGQDYDVVFSSFNQSCSDPTLIPKIVNAVKPGGDVVLRRFKDSDREGALKTLDWNLLAFEGKQLGSKAHSAGPIVEREAYLDKLKQAGLEVQEIVSVDAFSEIIFARKPTPNGSSM